MLRIVRNLVSVIHYRFVNLYAEEFSVANLGKLKINAGEKGVD